MKNRTEIRDLLVPLNDEEKALRAKQLAAMMKKIEAKKEEIHSIKIGMKTDLAALEEERDKLVNAVHTGAEYREIGCTWIAHGAVWEISRDDTGEVIDSAVIGEDERQEPLFDGEDAD